MNNLSDEQIANINDSCRNGFQLNVREYLINNKFELVKYRDVDEDTRIVYKLKFGVYYKTVKDDIQVNTNNSMKSYKMKKLIATDKFIVIMKVSTWNKSDSLDLWVDTNICKTVCSYKVITNRKSEKLLIRCTHKLTDEALDYLTE